MYNIEFFLEGLINHQEEVMIAGTLLIQTYHGGQRSERHFPRRHFPRRQFPRSQFPSKK